MIKYAKLGSHLPLNELVMAGSHDAGITEGGKNAQTQDRDIFGQAIAGVRIFDVRVAAQVVKAPGGGKQVEIRAIHADKKVQVGGKFTGAVGGVLGQKDVKTTAIFGGMGTYGETLTKMLADARRFVTTFTSEFLILKFDKSSNWPVIAEACVGILGDCIYKGNGLLNTVEIGHLAGKVIVLFTPSGFREAMGAGYGNTRGILEVVNLYSTPAVGDGFVGMTYFGKGGTNPFKGWGKFKDNQKKQAKLMAKAGNSDPQVMGMMYWTTTGLKESIFKRDEKMWSTPNQQKLKALWAGGMKLNYTDRLGGTDVQQPGHAQTLKAFMPNFVMIDFADPFKCKTIYELNEMSPTEMSRALQGYKDA